MLAALLLSAGAAALVVQLKWPSRDGFRGLAAAVSVSVVSAIVSVRMLKSALLGDPSRAITIFMVATAVRMILSLGGAIVLCKVLDFPLQMTLLWTMAFYLVILTAETWGVMRVLRNS